MDIPKSEEAAVNEVMETNILTTDSHTDRAESSYEAADEEDLLSLCNQYSNLLSPNSDWLSAEDSVIISAVSVEGISVTYHITVQQHATITLFDTGFNMSVT